MYGPGPDARVQFVSIEELDATRQYSAELGVTISRPS